jgi:hypothetical protein
MHLFLFGMSKSSGLMNLLAHLKFCSCILNFAGAVFEAKVAPAKDSHQQNSVGTCQKIPSLLGINQKLLWDKQQSSFIHKFGNPLKIPYPSCIALLSRGLCHARK